MGPLQEISISDKPARWGLRPALWHVAALSAGGYRFAPRQFHREPKPGRAEQVWRTWGVSSYPVVPTDQRLSVGAAELMAAQKEGKLAREVMHPYQAAWLGAKHYDLLRLAREARGIGGMQSAMLPAEHGVLSFLAGASELRTATTLRERAMGQGRGFVVRSVEFAAALVTLGFGLDGLTPEGHFRLFGVASLDAQRVESLLCPGLHLQAAQDAMRGLVAQTVAARGSSAGAAPPLQSPLPVGHPLHWAAMGALKRQALATLEANMDSPRSGLRVGVYESDYSAHAAVLTLEEFQQHKERVIRHLLARPQ